MYQKYILASALLLLIGCPTSNPSSPAPVTEIVVPDIPEVPEQPEPEKFEYCELKVSELCWNYWNSTEIVQGNGKYSGCLGYWTAVGMPQDLPNMPARCAVIDFCEIQGSQWIIRDENHELGGGGYVNPEFPVDCRLCRNIDPWAGVVSSYLQGIECPNP